MALKEAKFLNLEIFCVEFEFLNKFVLGANQEDAIFLTDATAAISDV
jgi:hypothetical protein